jgi:hypothetical protein
LNQSSSTLYANADNLRPRVYKAMTTHPSFVHIHHDSLEAEQSHLDITERKKHLLIEDDSQTIVQKINFSIPRCAACKEEVQFSEGDIIYGDKWYHNSCWKDTEK